MSYGSYIGYHRVNFPRLPRDDQCDSLFEIDSGAHHNRHNFDRCLAPYRKLIRQNLSETTVGQTAWAVPDPPWRASSNI
jgi:hypothetical protein